MEFSTTREIIKVLGGIRAVAELCGRKYDAVEKWQNAATNFPPDTYLVLTRALEQRGHAAPVSLWRMRVPSE